MNKSDLIKQKPDIRLYGDVCDSMVEDFLKQYDDAVKKEGNTILFELTTIGGDAEAARRIGLEIDLAREKWGKTTYFLGKTNVYSAGIAILSFFPQEYRFITKDTVLLIHERRMEKILNLKDKPIESCFICVEQVHSQIEMSKQLQAENFQRLAKGTKMSAEDIAHKALKNWYVRAEEAVNLGLVAGLAE
jgi:ATP-dependent Clp protease, protease subunit